MRSFIWTMNNCSLYLNMFCGAFFFLVVDEFLQYFMSFLTGKIWRVLQYNSNWYLILPVSINVCYTFYFRYSLGVSSPERFVRTRLYFTSESHIHSLLNMLRYGGLRDVSLCVRVISCLEPPFDWVILCWWYVALLAMLCSSETI